MKIKEGQVVVAVLHTPREKVVGVLHEIGPAGIQLRGLELGYFDDWCAAITANEPHLPMSDQFVPMWRVERISRDEDSPGAPSMSALFQQRTGLEFEDQ